MKQLRRFRDLTKLTLHATDGDLGAVEDLFLDAQSWQIRYLVVKTGSWLMGRDVLVTPAAVCEIDEAARLLRVSLSRQQIEGTPRIDRARPLSRGDEQAYFFHLRQAPYWDTVPGPAKPAVPLPGTIPPSLERVDQPLEAESAHLWSANELSGYAIEAQDGEIGHVEEVVVDDEDWLVRYVEVDTRNWLPGKKVLIQAARIDRIDPLQRTVSVSLARQTIESAPAYNPAELITPGYEIELFKHYSKTAA